MLTAHNWVAYAVIAVAGLAAVWGGVTYLRRAEAGATLGHVLALVQTVCVVLAPWFYAPTDPRRRLAWFAGTSLVAAALAVRAWTTSG